MKCPFCFQDILDDAIWCRHCQKTLTPASKPTPPRARTTDIFAKTAPPPKAQGTDMFAKTAPPPKAQGTDMFARTAPPPKAAGSDMFAKTAPPPRAEKTDIFAHSAPPPRPADPEPGPTSPPAFGQAGPPPSQSGAGVTLWDFSQELDHDTPDRIALEAEEQHQHELEFAIDEVHKRVEEINTLMEGGKNQEAADEALAARTYIQSLGVSAPDIEADLAAVEGRLELLDEMGYKPRDLQAEKAKIHIELPRITLGKLVSIALVIMVIWGGCSLLQRTQDTPLRQPGSIAGTLMIRAGEGGRYPQPLPFQTVQLFRDDADSKVLRDRVNTLQERLAAWKLLSGKIANVKPTGTAKTDNVGHFSFNQVPPGDYFLVTTGPDEDNPIAWLVPLKVNPLKTTKSELNMDNALKGK